MGSGLAAVITRTATTPTYRLILSVGPSEAMYTLAQVKTKNPQSGEVMVGGAMSMGGHAMTMEGGVIRHLELYVRLRANGKVVNVAPTIALTDESATTMMSTPLHVVAMVGIGKGATDLHYGNNVALILNHVYSVLVTLAGQREHFTFRAS